MIVTSVWKKFHEAVSQRYSHWSSEMRDEMIQGIKRLEKEIEAKHYSARLRGEK